jgi:hypothetical protein
LIALASLWLLTPFATGALLGASPGARRLAARHYPALLGLGIGGLALVALGAFVLPQPVSLVALGLGGPLSGLSFWTRRSGGEDDGPGGDDDDEPGPPPPGGDWDQIVREFERHVERHSGPSTPGRERTPERPAPVTPSLV